MNNIFFLIFLFLNTISSVQSFDDYIFNNIFSSLKRNPGDLNIKQWLNNLIIDLPNDLIQNETKGYIEDLTIYNISLESLITTRKKILDKKYGFEITFRNAGFNTKGKYNILSKVPKFFLANFSTLNIKLPIFLIKNETGLITEVDTSGFNIDLDHTQIGLDIENKSEIVMNIIIGILKLVLKFIKNNIIEKNLIALMNKELENAFEKVNEIILSGVQPDKLNNTINKNELADVRNSSIIGSLAYLLSNLTGVNGPFSLNNLINIFTNDTGIIPLKKYMIRKFILNLI